MLFSWGKSALLFPKKATFLPSQPSYFSPEFYADLAMEYSTHHGWTERERAVIVERVLAGIQENLPSRSIAQEIIQALAQEENDTWHQLAQTAAANVQLWQYLETLVRSHPVNRWRQSSLYIPDIQVLRIPPLVGCPTQCRSLWLDAEGTPKRFALAELVANGSNYGRQELRPVVGVVHAGCLCSQVQPYASEMEEAFALMRSQHGQLQGLFDKE
jgi:hypothetical protein